MYLITVYLITRERKEKALEATFPFLSLAKVVNKLIISFPSNISKNIS